MRKELCGALIAALAIAIPSVAQEQRSSFEGVILDELGDVIPGATVEVRNPQGMVLATVSGLSGNYRFPALPPGRWEIMAALDGFRPTRQKNLEIALGQALRVNLVLKVGEFSEAIHVVGEAPTMDLTQSARSTSIRDEFLEKLPKGRDFLTLATQAPGANVEKKGGGLSIDGASASENRYLIDGIETTNLRTGTSGKDLVPDFIEEIQVKSSGYTAEFAGATGGVLNVITKSGTNRFKGSVFGWYSGSALGYAFTPPGADAGTPDATISEAPAYSDGRKSLQLSPVDASKAGYVTYDKDDILQIEPGFTLSGPLARDRAWFFVAYNPQLRTIERTALNAAQESVTRQNTQTTHFLSANVSTALGERTEARIAFNNDYRIWDGILPNLNGTSPSNAIYDVKYITPNWSLSGNLDHTVSSSLALGLRGGYFTSNLRTEGVPVGTQYTFGTSNLGLPGIPSELQRVPGYSEPSTINAVNQDRQTRLGLQADATGYATWAGQHTIKVGVEFDRIGNQVDRGETGNRVILYWDRAYAGQRGAYGYYRVRSNGSEPKRGVVTLGDIRSDNWGIFLQDSWTIARRLTLNLGVRTERETVPAFSDDPQYGSTVIQFDFEDKVAPRLGFSLDVKGDGKWKLYGSYGVFYDPTKLEMSRTSFGGEKWWEYWYTLDTPEWTTLASSPECPPACPGQRLAGPVDFRFPTFDTVDPSMKPYTQSEATAGIEHELRPKISLAVRYIHKHLDWAIDDIGSVDENSNEIYTIGNPGRGPASVAYTFADGTVIPLPKAKRVYDAVELSFNKRMADNWSLRLSYLWSRLHGNYSGLSQSDENGRISPNLGRAFDYPIMAFDENGRPVEGPLATDRPHQFKGQGIYDFKFGLTAGLNFYAASGTPISREAAFIAPNAFPVQYRGRNSDGRTPFFTETDLFVQQEIKLGGGKRLQIIANVLNLFNQQTAINKWRTELESGQQVSVTEEQFYRGIDTEALIAKQGQKRDPRFLMEGEFQAPREVRLGLRLLF